MKISELDDNIKLTDFENFFDIFVDKNQRNYFNLNMTIYFQNVPIETYDVKYDQFWNNLSYNIYGTTRLWWLLMKINNVDINHTFDIVPAGSTIKKVSKENAMTIVTNIRE